MAIPAEKLNMMMEELLNRSSESAKDLNIISLEEYKKLNADKVAYLHFLKNYVSGFNKENYWFLKILLLAELFYLSAVCLKNLNIIPENTEKVKEKIHGLNFEIFPTMNLILNDIKSYPNPRLKKTSLKINDKTYKSFLKTKRRFFKLEQEIEQYDFTPQQYMLDAIENIEHICKKYEEYKDNPEALLDILDYYYSTDDELEWTDEDREFVAKNYA